jgi:hypothetical protein
MKLPWPISYLSKLLFAPRPPPVPLLPEDRPPRSREGRDRIVVASVSGHFLPYIIDPGRRPRRRD